MIRKLKTEISTSIKNKKINIFFLFLFLAFIILIFSKLSKEYTKTIAFSINKINVPQENIILNDSNTVLNITLKTHGFKWLNYYFSEPKIAIDFSKDVEKNKTMFLWSKSSAYIKNTQFSKQVELLSMFPDTLFFRYDVNLIKKVPVILNSNIKFSPGFNISETYSITPDSIRIIGPDILVSKIESIESEDIVLTDIKADINETVKLKLPENITDLKFSNKSIQLTATVEKFTEGILKIPVTVKNIPTGIKLKFFPKNVNVTYYTSLNNFNSITGKDFKIECDYSKITSNQTYMIPELVQAPKTVKNVKINQQQIEFIIIK